MLRGRPEKGPTRRGTALQPVANVPDSYQFPFLFGRFYNTDHDPRDSYLLESSARSQALAIRQSRLGGPNETPRTWAVSSLLNPPKYRSSATRLFRASTRASVLSASASASTSLPRVCADTST